MFIIENFEVKSINRGLFESEYCDAAVAKISDGIGATMFVSRYTDEEYWVIDTLFFGSSMPTFSNGEGARVTRLRTLRSESEIAELLNKKFDEAFAVA